MARAGVRATVRLPSDKAYWRFDGNGQFLFFSLPCTHTYTASHRVETIQTRKENFPRGV